MALRSKAVMEFIYTQVVRIKTARNCSNYVVMQVLNEKMSPPVSQRSVDSLCARFNREHGIVQPKARKHARRHLIPTRSESSVSNAYDGDKLVIFTRASGANPEGDSYGNSQTVIEKIYADPSETMNAGKTGGKDIYKVTKKYNAEGRRRNGLTKSERLLIYGLSERRRKKAEKEETIEEQLKREEKEEKRERQKEINEMNAEGV